MRKVSNKLANLLTLISRRDFEEYEKLAKESMEAEPHMTVLCLLGHVCTATKGDGLVIYTCDNCEGFEISYPDNYLKSKMQVQL